MQQGESLLIAQDTREESLLAPLSYNLIYSDWDGAALCWLKMIMNGKKKVSWWRDLITQCDIMTRSYLPYCMNSLIFFSLFFFVYFWNSVFFILTQTDLLNSFLYPTWLSLTFEICPKLISQLWIFMSVSCDFVSRSVYMWLLAGCCWRVREGSFFCSIAPCVSQMWMADSIR